MLTTVKSNHLYASALFAVPGSGSNLPGNRSASCRIMATDSVIVVPSGRVRSGTWVYDVVQE
jgi:hypothetical protein